MLACRGWPVHNKECLLDVFGLVAAETANSLAGGGGGAGTDGGKGNKRSKPVAHACAVSFMLHARNSVRCRWFLSSRWYSFIFLGHSLLAKQCSDRLQCPLQEKKRCLSQPSLGPNAWETCPATPGCKSAKGE